MTEIASLVGGLGLFAVGMWFLTENLKQAASRRLRRTAQRWTEHPMPAFGWGVLAGGATQCMTALVFIVVSLLRSGLVTTKGAFALILGGAGGGTLLVMIATFDIRTVSLFVLGISGMAVASESLSRYRWLAAAFLGGAMIVLGLSLLKGAAAPLAEEPWFQNFLHGTGDSPFLVFLTAALLTAAVQSSSAVSVFAISLAGVGVLTVDEVIMCIWGTFIGSGAIMYVLSTNLAGRSRQVAMYQVYWNVAICAVTIPLFYAEHELGIPSIKALILAVPVPLEQQLALVYVIGTFGLMPVMLRLLDPTVRLFERLWPDTPIDQLARTKFIHDHATVDVGTSTVLAELEQKRAFGLLSQYFDAVRREAELAPVRAACRNVLYEISQFLDELHQYHPMQQVESRNALMSRQKLLWWLEGAAGTMCEALLQPGSRKQKTGFRGSVCEGVDIVLLAVADAMNSADADAWSTASRLIGDRGDLMRGMRARYAELDPPPEPSESANFMTITNKVEEVFFLLAKVESEFRPEPTAAGSEADPVGAAERLAA